MRNRHPMQWLPDPVEFAEEFCKPDYSDFGLPEPESAWSEAAQHCLDGKHDWSHEAVFVAMRLTNRYDIAHADPMKKAHYQLIYQKFMTNYEASCNQVMNGQDMTAGLVEDKSKEKPRPRSRSAEEIIESKKIGESALSNLLSEL